MPNYEVPEASLSSIANAIRTKGGTSSPLIFPDGFISAIQNIPQSGNPTLIDKSITSNGTYNASSDHADGYLSVTVAVPTRIIIGTFTPDSSEIGLAKRITVPYVGSGYPLGGIIFPTTGSWKSNSTIYTLAQKAVITFFAFSKCNTLTTPTYESLGGESNTVCVVSMFKNSSSDATNVSASSGKEVEMFQRYDASSTPTGCVRFKSATDMTVKIADATNPSSAQYGFKEGVEYTYYIVYSS